MGEGLPPELLAQLSCVPEEPPADFECAVCQSVASNRYHWSPRDYERPPVCSSCESTKGYDWTGRPRLRGYIRGGTARDKSHALRIDALADAIAAEANQQKWSARYAA